MRMNSPLLLLAFVFVLSIFPFHITASTSSKTIIADLHKRADELIKQENWVPAIDIYDEILMISPSDQKAWHNRGLSFERLGQVFDALESFDKALSFRKYRVGLSAKGNLLQRVGNYEEALAAFEEATKLDPKNVQGWNDLGTIYLVMDGDVEKAREAFKKAVALDPNFLEANYNLCNLLLKEKKYLQTAKCLAPIIKKHPDYLPALVAQAVLLVEEQDKESAEKLLRHIIERDPRNADAHFNLAALLLDQGPKFMSEAKEHHSTCLEIDPFHRKCNEYSYVIEQREKEFQRIVDRVKQNTAGLDVKMREGYPLPEEMPIF